VSSVSVVVPVYNGERYLAEALQSVLAQTSPPAEVLVFDNASTDKTVEIAARHVPADAIRRSAVNSGAAVNFNRAVRESSGEYVLWLAADDRLLPEHLERCLQALVDRPGAPACLPGIRFIDVDGRPTRHHTDPDLAAEDPRRRLRSFLRRHRWTESYCLYRRDALLASPMFTTEYATDVLLTWWFVLRGPLVVVSEPLFEYREYPTKTVEETARGLDPHAPEQHWRKCRLWRRLWQESSSGDVEAGVARVARQELLLCLVHRHWMKHLAEDLWVFLMSYSQRHRSPVTGLLTIMLRAVERSSRERRLRRDGTGL
jgi:glycosyltransferase involved in cell wall biosynthesis